MKLLAIETSCDETGVTIIEFNKPEIINNNDSTTRDNISGKDFVVIKNLLVSQMELHKDYGGVFPNLAKREHMKTLPILIEEAMQGLDFSDIDAIAVTHGPGLSPALWVGIEAAKQISNTYNIPVYPINHMEGHIYASVLSDISKNLELKYKNENKKNKTVQNLDNRINDEQDEVTKIIEQRYEFKKINYPALALLISGGHTELVFMPSVRNYKKVGETQDDAIGEAFDKAARSMGLPYPGGPEISKLASIARQNSQIVDEKFRLPRPMLHSGDLNFSFSGLKTAVLYATKKYTLSQNERQAFCMEFENAVTDVIIKKVREAIYLYNIKTLIVGGGVSANDYIRTSIQELAEKEGIELLLPDRKLSTDNSLMISAIACAQILDNVEPVKALDIVATPNLSL